MKKLIIILIMVAIITSGCGIAYNAKRNELLKTAKPSDYGPPPPADYCEIQKQFILTLLKDPQSAEFECGNDITTEIIQDDFTSPNPILVWITSEQVNAKNSFGGYTGYKYYLFAWKDSKIYAVAFPDQNGRIGIWQYYNK